jgi:alkylated DNA repair protein (DNA oxidative demethylase)
MGLHQDRDEADFSWPIVSFSFGANAVFALGGLARRDPVTRFPLAPGDVLVLHGPARLRFHGVDRLKAGGDVPHPVIPPGGRINLTFRRAA